MKDKDIIKAFETHLLDSRDCELCPYGPAKYKCEMKLLNDVLELIKNQQAEIERLKQRQIPKKPIKQIWIDDEKHKGDVRLATKDDVLTKDNHGSINLCPNCKERVMTYKYLSPPNDKDYYCKHCGQALDWNKLTEKGGVQE